MSSPNFFFAVDLGRSIPLKGRAALLGRCNLLSVGVTASLRPANVMFHIPYLAKLSPGDLLHFHPIQCEWGDREMLSSLSDTLWA